MSQQPEWELIANLGDATPLDYGGYFVFRDRTGVYPEEAELLQEPCDDLSTDDPKARWTVYRFILERCTLQDGILSDNPYHPDYPAWFAEPESRRHLRPQDTTYLKDVADCAGLEAAELERLFCSDDPCERACAYREVGEYHGWRNFDDYPLTLTRAEVEARYAPYQEIVR